MGLMDEFKMALEEEMAQPEYGEMLAQREEEIAEEMENAKWAVMYDRWLRTSGTGNVVEIEVEGFKKAKEMDCFLCGRVPGEATIKYNGNTWEGPDNYVGRIDPDEGFVEGNTIGFCKGCSKKVRGRHVFEYIAGVLGPANMAGLEIVKNKAGLEEAKQHMIALWREQMGEEKGKKWWL